MEPRRIPSLRLAGLGVEDARGFSSSQGWARSVYLERGHYALGNLLAQYLIALIQERRTRSDRIRREIGITTLLMAELGEAIVRMRVNVALMRVGSAATLAKLDQADTDTWHDVKLDVAQLWMPASVFAVSETYTAIRLVNIEIGGRTHRINEADFVKTVEEVVESVGKTVKTLERRQLRVGRE